MVYRFFSKRGGLEGNLLYGILTEANGSVCAERLEENS